MADDGEVLDSWEELDDKAVFDKKLKEFNENMKPKTVRLLTPLQDDSLRTAYQPQVKILKRQPGTGAPTNRTGNSANNVSIVRPLKTLEQREAEYAEARLRIMGCATGYDGQQTQLPSDTSKPVKLLQQMEYCSPDNNIVRQPKGPDGSRGFISAPR
ncbi:SUZ domain-containing protein 1-like [Argonauta hians]